MKVEKIVKGLLVDQISHSTTYIDKFFVCKFDIKTKNQSQIQKGNTQKQHWPKLQHKSCSHGHDVAHDATFNHAC